LLLATGVLIGCAFSFSLSSVTWLAVEEDITDDDLRCGIELTGSEDRDLPDVDRTRLDVELDNGVPRLDITGGGLIRVAFVVEVLGRNVDVSFFTGVSETTGLAIAVTELGRGRFILGVANASD